MRSKENGGFHTRLKFTFTKSLIAANGPNNQNNIGSIFLYHTYKEEIFESWGWEVLDTVALFLYLLIVKCEIFLCWHLIDSQT